MFMWTFFFLPFNLLPFVFSHQKLKTKKNHIDVNRTWYWRDFFFFFSPVIDWKSYILIHIYIKIYIYICFFFSICIECCSIWFTLYRLKYGFSFLLDSFKTSNLQFFEAKFLYTKVKQTRHSFFFVEIIIFILRIR